jgi:hypothetical protein
MSCLSAAYAVAEARRWRSGLWRKPKDAPFFYGTLTLATPNRRYSEFFADQSDTGAFIGAQ